MKNLIIIASLFSFVSCSSLEGDSLMNDLRSSEKTDTARMQELGLVHESSSELEFIDPEDRLLLIEALEETSIASGK